MSNDLGNNKVHAENGSATGHVSKVFEESSVCAVAAILSNHNKPRKLFRSLIFLLFTFAFLYQCIAFLCYVLKYPTVVEIKLLKAERFMGPAYTFCNINPIKRSKFCAKYPRNCTKPDGKFCDKHPRFCGTPDTMILKEDDFDIDSLEEFFQLNHEAEDMYDFRSYEEFNPVGPFPRSNPYEMSMFVGACFTFNDRVNSHLDPHLKMRNPLGSGMGESYRFDPEENELLYPEERAGIMFQVHSPFEAVNPFQTGTFMRPGHLYRISVKVTQEELLPHECQNYTEVWLKNNKTGYRSQASCKNKCAGDTVMKCLNCTEPLVLYPYPTETFCTYKFDTSKLTGMCKNPDDFVQLCMNECKEDCEKIKFSYEVQESIRNKYMHQAERNESREIRVNVEFPAKNMKKIIHKPQFQVLEIFSLIGGLLAFWIGLSMFQVVEVFDCLFQAVKHIFNNRSTKSRSAA